MSTPRSLPEISVFINVADSPVNYEEKYATPASQRPSCESKVQASPSLNQPSIAPKKHHKHSKVMTEEERAIARTRKARNRREPDYLDRQQTLFQKSLEPQLKLKCEMKEHFMKHIFWKAKNAAKTELEHKDKTKQKHVRFNV